FPYRLRIAGTDTIRAMWKRLLGESDGSGAFAGLAIPRESFQVTECISDEVVMQAYRWEFVDDAGVRQGVDHVAIFRFEGDRILSESVFNDTSTMRYLDGMYAQLKGFPGVTEM